MKKILLTLFKNPSSNKIKSMMLSNDDFDESKIQNLIY